MKKLLFNQNYQNDLFDIEFLYKKKYILFKIKNFLDEDSYKFINNSFPKIDYKKLENFDIKENNYKYAIISADKDYNQLLDKDERLRIIHNSIFSRKFFYYFYKNLKNEFLKSRAKDLKSLIKLLKPKVLDLSQSYTKNFFYTYIRRQIEYSFIFNKGKIVPHTDGKKKLLSLMLYFPEGQERESEIGTTFWESNIKNFNNEHLKDSQKEIDFKKNNKALIKLDFNKYDLYGFIKNDKSWHSVEPFDLNDGYVRKSMNINFYL